MLFSFTPYITLMRRRQMLLSTLAFMAASACGQQGSDMSNEKFATQKDAALYQAAAKGDLTQARQLLAEGASLNSRNAREMTPLDVAMVEGNRRAFDSLLELGADPTWLGDARDTSMHLAAILHDSRWLAVLLKRGFSTEVKNALGETPLFGALGPDTQDNMQLLLDAGADVHARAKDDRTLLHHAAMIGSFSDIPRLLKLGVDPRAEDQLGKTFQYYFFMGPRDPEVEKKVRAWLHDHGIAVEERRK